MTVGCEYKNVYGLCGMRCMAEMMTESGAQVVNSKYMDHHSYFNSLSPEARTAKTKHRQQYRGNITFSHMINWSAKLGERVENNIATMRTNRDRHSLPWDDLISKRMHMNLNEWKKKCVELAGIVGYK